MDEAIDGVGYSAAGISGVRWPHQSLLATTGQRPLNSEAGCGPDDGEATGRGLRT